MKSELVKLGQFSGNEASIYGIWFEDLQKTSFDIFINENKNVFLSELNDIISRLKSISNATGAREQFFKSMKVFQAMVFVHCTTVLIRNLDSIA